MQNAVLFDNMPASLAEKVQELAQQTATKARNICSRNSVPQDVADVFIADAIDILRAQYDGLRATTKQMRVLTERVPQRSWDRTENAALCFIARYYADIIAHVDGSPSLGGGFIEAVVACEQIKRMPADYIIDVDEDAMQQIRDDAQRLYYTYALLIVGELCDATPEELRGIRPRVGLTEQKRDKLIVFALRAQETRRQIEQKQTARRAKRMANPTAAQGEYLLTDADEVVHTHRTPPTSLPTDKTIKQFQSVAYMIGGGSSNIKTADAGKDGRIETPQPLWQAIDKQRRDAQALLDNPDADDDEKRQAAQLITNTYAVTQVLDGLQILPQVLPPDSGTTSRMIWDMTTYQYARTILGIDNPKAEQVTALLRATAFLSTQRTTIAEKATKRITYIDENGVRKRKKVEREAYTNFQPVVVEFRTEYEDKVLIEEATRIRIELHRLFADGRTAEYIGDGRQREYIEAPRQQYLTIGQYYDFSTENERTFRNIILSKPKQAEDAMLSAVFNYPQRQAQQDEKAAAARATAQQTRAAAEAMAANPTATPEQIAVAKQQAAEAEDAAERATAQAKYYISNHVGNDVQRLKAMFEKALRNGLITGYYDTGRNGYGGKVHYGRGVVWYWLRGKNSGKEDKQV